MRSGTLIRVTIGVLLILVLFQGVQAAETYSVIMQMSVPSSPWGVVVDNTNGWIYAADHDIGRIYKFDKTGNPGFPVYWDADNWGIGIDNLGIVYTDGNIPYFDPVKNKNYYIDKYDSNGLSQGHIVSGQLSGMRGIAVNSTGYIYIAEWSLNQIQVYDKDGNFVNKWGARGNRDGYFNGPEGIAVDSAGNVYVTDHENNRVQKFTADGRFLIKWGTKGSNRDGAFNGPEGIAVDSANNVYITDESNYQVQKFNSNGIFITRWGTTGTSGIAVDSAGNVYVTDYSNKRVEVFAPARQTPTITWFNPADITYGDALGTNQLNAIASVEGSFVYTPAAGTVLNAGTGQTLHTDFTPTDRTKYNSASMDVTINVIPKSASVTPATAGKTYGETDPALTGTLTGFLPADGVTAVYSRTAGETVVGSPYTISAVLSPAGVLTNYDITYNTANFVIDKRAVTVTADAKSKTYGEADPALTYQITSGSLAFSDSFTGALTRVAGEDFGIYAIRQGDLALNDNYVLSYVGADLAIGKKAASVTPAATGKTYGEADPALTGTLTGFLPADGVTAVYSRTAGETVVGSPYTISAVLSPAGVLTNYDITYNTANFAIDKRAVTITADAKSKSYGDADPALTHQITSGSLAFSDAFTGALTRVAGEDFGIYAIQQGDLALNDNYVLSYVGADLAIGKIAASVTPAATGQSFGEADPALTGTLTGFLPAD